ncbi:MAG: GGDEF domain-containing protein [Lacipirellulaceae bacterium]
MALPLVVVNVLFAAIALAMGFAAGAWVFGGATPQEPAPPSPEADEEIENARRIDRERTLMASEKLRDLAAGVVQDVGAHNASITQIEAEIAEARSSGVDVEDLETMMRRISDANADLQQKLVLAEEHIQTQAEAIRTHESEARTDALTGLANRRAFDDELRRRFAEWRRKGTPVSLLIGDVDHFKKFNDTHGHQAGDEVLRKVAGAMAECAREMDLACRYGGEEFAVVMPTTTAVDGIILAERIRKRIESQAIEFEGKKLSVTMSIGLADAAGDDDEPERLLKRADEALYRSKGAGRNNGHLHNGVECVPITEVHQAEPKPAAPESAAIPTLVLDKLPNRTRFVEELRQACRAHEDSGEPLSLLATELNGYAKLLDEFGPAVATLTLDSIAQFLDNALRDIDLLGRLDDGQFVVQMPGRTAKEAQAVGKRIGDALANCSVPLGEGSLQLQTSMSVAECQPGDTPVTLMQRVETGLLVASRTPLGVPVLA